jgi:hypothetical protein
LQVTLYGIGKEPEQFHVEHDGKVADGWWHVVDIKVEAGGKISLVDADSVTPMEEGGSDE